MTAAAKNWATIGSDTFTNVFQMANVSRVIVSQPARNWRREIETRLNELTALERGWDGYNARPVSFDTAYFAMQMLEAICRSDAITPQIVPGTDGDLQIEWHTDSGDVELHVQRPYRVAAWRSNEFVGPNGEERLLTNDFTNAANWVREVTEPAIANAAAA